MIDRAAAVGVHLLWQTVVTGLASGRCMAGVKPGAFAVDCRSGRRSFPGTSVGRSRRKRSPPTAFRFPPPLSCFTVDELHGALLGKQLPALCHPGCARRNLRRCHLAGPATCALTRRLRNFLPLPTASKDWSGLRRRGARFRQRENCGRYIADEPPSSATLPAAWMRLPAKGSASRFGRPSSCRSASPAGNLKPYQARHRSLARRPALMSWLMLTLEGRDSFRQRVMQAFATQPRTFAEDAGPACRRGNSSYSSWNRPFAGMGFADPMKKTTIAAIVVFWLGRATLAHAQFNTKSTLNFVPTKSTVNFTLGDILHTVHGSFNVKRGAVHFDPATNKIRGEILVEAASGNSGSSGRDKTNAE